MYLNTIKPAAGSKRKSVRVGRGIGSGLGKTCGRGHKGALARAGGKRRLGFEGGQMPLQRRIPKSGFKSKISATTDEIRLHEIANLDVSEITLETLRAVGLINSSIVRVKIIAKGEISKPLTIKGIAVTAGAKKLIEAAGGKVEASN